MNDPEPGDPRESTGPREATERPESTERRSGDTTTSIGMPVAEPESDLAAALSGRSVRALDSSRQIAPVPGADPWRELPVGAGGVTQELPVRYGASARTEVPVRTGFDEVLRRVGAAPAAGSVTVREGRDRLPSLARRDRRSRRVTLVGFASVTVLCVLGLWGVAAIAFGW